MQELDWLGLNLYAAGESKHHCMESIRRYSFCVQFRLAGPIFHSYGDLGYSQAKARNMMRIYFNEGSLKAAASKAAKRKDHAITSVAFTFVNATKRSESQGHCMQTGVFSFGRKHEPTLTLFYRSTEVTKKFGADLVFLREEVVPELCPEDFLRKGQRFNVVFNFAMCYFSIHFIPILEGYGIGTAVSFLETIRRTNHDYWLQALRRLPWFFDPRFNSRMSMIRSVKEYTEDRPRLLRALEAYYDENISNLPRGVKRDPPRP